MRSIIFFILIAPIGAKSANLRSRSTLLTLIRGFMRIMVFDRKLRAAKGSRYKNARLLISNYHVSTWNASKRFFFSLSLSLSLSLSRLVAVLITNDDGCISQRRSLLIRNLNDASCEKKKNTIHSSSFTALFRREVTSLRVATRLYRICWPRLYFAGVIDEWDCERR